MIVDNREEWRVKYEHHMALKNCKHKDWRYNKSGFKVCKFCKEIVGCYTPHPAHVDNLGFKKEISNERRLG